MLDVLRHKGFGSVVVGGMVIVTAVVFVIQFNPAAGKMSGPLSRACAANVKGHCIDPKDHRGAYLMMIPRDQSGNRLMKRAQAMGLPRITLDGLVERELLIAEAERLGLGVTQAEVTENIFNGVVHVSVPSDKPELYYSLGVHDGKILVNFRDSKTKTFDEKAYKRSLKFLTDRTEIEFREEQERELVASKVRDLVRSPVRVSEAEAYESFVADKSQATVAWLEVKQSFVARYAMPFTDAEEGAWAKETDNAAQVQALAQQRKQASLPKDKHVRHILVKVDPKAGSAEKDAALAKLSFAYARIKKGEALADVARDVGQDGTSASGGDLGDRTDAFIPAFRKVADALKPGEMTEKAVETQFGYHLIARDDPSRTKDVEAQLVKDAAHELFVKAKSLDLTKSVAQKLGEAIKAGKVPEDVVKEWLATLAVPAGAPTMLEVMRDAPATGDAGTAAAPDGGAAANDAPKGTPKVIGAQDDPDRPQATTSSPFNRGGDPIPILVGDVAAKVMDFSFGSKDGAVLGEPARTNDGFVVVQLKEHKNANREDFDKERDTYVQTLLAAKQAEALALYVKRLRTAAKADVEVDEKYMQQWVAHKDGGVSDVPEDEDEY